MKRIFVLLVVIFVVSMAWASNAVIYPRDSQLPGRVTAHFTDDLNNVSLTTKQVNGLLNRIVVNSLGTENSWKVYVKDDSGVTLFSKTDCNSTLVPYSYPVVQWDASSTCLMRGVMVSGPLTIQVKDVNYTSEIQTLSFSSGGNVPTGGTFTLSFSGATTAALAYNASKIQVNTALNGLSTIGPNDVNCTGGPLPSTPVAVHFKGILAQRDVPAITVNVASLTGGTGAHITGTVAESHKGGNDLSEVDVILYYSTEDHSN